MVYWKSLVGVILGLSGCLYVPKGDPFKFDALASRLRYPQEPPVVLEGNAPDITLGSYDLFHEKQFVVDVGKSLSNLVEVLNRDEDDVLFISIFNEPDSSVMYELIESYKSGDVPFENLPVYDTFADFFEMHRKKQGFVLAVNFRTSDVEGYFDRYGRNLFEGETISRCYKPGIAYKAVEALRERSWYRRVK